MVATKCTDRIGPAMSEQEEQQYSLLTALRDPRAYPHSVQHVEHVETHISHVLLAGNYAYKIKKPLDLGFLDFSTPEKRRFYCEEELRLNRRLAPELYEAVVGFGGSPEEPTFNAGGNTFEYAVRMRRFDREQELSRLLERDRLPLEWMDELAQIAATFHGRIPCAGADSPLGTPEAVLRPMEENFAPLHELLQDAESAEKLSRLQAWTRSRYQSLHPLLEQRHRLGFIRECHGDMHLGNMTRIDDRLVIFDGIEFSEELRWIDIISEVAFVTMDLTDRGAPAHAHRFLNTWLEHTGDYEGIALLRFYETYRAMVRAKVAGIRARQESAPSGREQGLGLCREYLHLAEHLIHSQGAALFINHGFSGSGKTTLSRPLLEQLGAIRVRADVERKRLAGMSAVERGDSDIGAGLYSPDMSARTYDRLETVCEQVLAAGLPVIADATFLRRDQRRRFARLARRLHLPCIILDYRAPEALLRERVEIRAEHGTDASDAGLEVLEHQLQSAEPLEEDEVVIPIHHDQPLPLERLRSALRFPGEE